MLKKLQRHLLASRQMVFLWFRRYGWRLTYILVLVIFLLVRDFDVHLNFKTIATEEMMERGEASLNFSPSSIPLAQAIASKNHSKKQRAYVERFAQVAQEEMKKFGIPASITLAQGLLESQAGLSPLAKESNNHFGIKCFSKKCKKGHCRNFTDDSHKDFFRIYKTAWESYRAHSQFLQKDRYRHLLNLPKNDYHGWAQGLQKAGYATDRSYAEKLIRLIERLELGSFDV